MRFAAALAAAGLSLIALAAAVVPLPVGDEALAQPAATIQVGDLWFCDPSYENGVCETTVNAGDAVVWEWGPGGSGVGNAHTTTNCADSFTLCGGPREWDSADLSKMSGRFPHTFGPEDTGKTFLYICQIHPLEMRGRITVLAAPTPTPTVTPTPTPTPQPTPQPTAVQGGGQTPAGGDQPAAVPSGGGAPAEDGRSGLPWLAAAAGVALAAAGLAIGTSAAVIMLRARRR